MDPQAFQLLTTMIQNNKDDADKNHLYVITKLEEILKWKYRIVGGSVVISIICGTAFNIALKVFFH